MHVSRSLDHSEARSSTQIGISPAEGGWTVANDKLWCESLHVRVMFKHRTRRPPRQALITAEPGPEQPWHRCLRRRRTLCCTHLNLSCKLSQPELQCH
jgi:hypothetical protein